MKKNRFISALAILGAATLVAARLYAAVTISSTNVPLPIPDNGNVNSTLDWNVGSAGGPVATDVNLTVAITHTWESDIAVSLTAPAGAATLIWNNCGGSGDDFAVTIDDAAAGGMPCASFGTKAGTFQASTAAITSALQPGIVNATRMSTFNVNPFGIWTLNTADDSSVCTGTLTAWSLTINGPAPLPVELTKIEAN
ncbi:MAG: proprotein convertase P-domain-containing protein [Thermoanaerobaculia bacterium]